MRRVVLSLVLWLVIGPQPAVALDIFVDGTVGSDVNDGLSWASPKATIGAALVQATGSVEPDVVSVASGLYAELLIMPPDTILRGGFPRGGGPRDAMLHPTIVDGRGAGPVIALGPGTDASILDGLTIRGGWTDRASEAGGVAITGAAPLVTGCIMEGNEGNDAGGVSVVVSAGPLPRIEWCRLARNRARTRGSAMLVMSYGAASAAASPVLIDSLVEGNIGIPDAFNLAGAVMLCGSALVENVLFRDNIGDGLSMGCGGQPGQPGSTRLQRAFNCEFSGNTRAGASLQCSADQALFEDCTFSGNGVTPVLSIFCGAGIWDATIRRSIAWPSGLQDGPPVGCTCFASNSISAGGWRGQADVLDIDPIFVAGPGGDYDLSHLAAGQATDSPAIDIGSVTAASLGLDTRSTRTDSAFDVGAVDLGVHYRAFGTLTLLRGQLPTTLAPIATMLILPVADAPGVLSDPALPLLYYSIERVDNEIHLAKDVIADTVRISF